MPYLVYEQNVDLYYILAEKSSRTKRYTVCRRQTPNSHHVPAAVRFGGNPEKSTWSWKACPALEKDIRRRSLTLLWNGAWMARQRMSQTTTVTLVLTPTGAVTFICCVSTDPGLTLGFDIGNICSCCD
jgi:hypothetical protein